MHEKHSSHDSDSSQFSAHVRSLTPADIPAGLDLVSSAGWNQTEADWRMFLAAAPGGCFGMEHNGKIIGTITTTPHGPFAWVGMVLVHPRFRGRGVATRLMNHALAHLATVPAVKLDATPAGLPVYAKLGFIEEYGLARFVHPAAPTLACDPVGVRPMQPSDIPLIAALDRDAFGGDRMPILLALRSAAPGRCWVVESGGRITGYALGRAGGNFDQVGPVIADSVEGALRLLGAALPGLHGRPVLLDVPDSQTVFREALFQAGFVVQRPFTRMVRGPNLSPGELPRVFAAAGPEIG